MGAVSPALGVAARDDAILEDATLAAKRCDSTDVLTAVNSAATAHVINTRWRKTERGAAPSGEDDMVECSDMRLRRQLRHGRRAAW